MKTKIFILFTLLFLVAVSSYSQVGNIEQALEENTASVQNVIATFKTWAMWIMGLAFIIAAATTVLGGQEGGDKTKKIGSFFMYLGFVGLAIVIITSLFGI
jgi:hypothetical protein